MENDIENIDSTNDEVIEEETTNSTNGDETTEDGTEQYTPREKQLYERLKKAEAAAKANGTTKPPTNDFGYDVKAYLKASGITANEFDFVKAEMKASGLQDVDTLLENDYFKSKLEKHREVAKTEDATPSGKRSGGVATNSVDYWLSKPIEDVPNEHRRAVVNAKIERESKKSQFYNG